MYGNIRKNHIFIQLNKILNLKYKYNLGGIEMIEKTTKIGDLLKIAPEKADILLEAGMHCLGCPAAQEETIEEACAVHGIDVDELIEKINS